MHQRALVVGAGFAGACAAWMLRERLGFEVTVLERSDVPGGMLRTLYTEEGLAYEYGPRVVSVFRGTADVLPFLRQFVDLQERRIYQGTRLRPDYPVVPFPVDMRSLRALPCGSRIRSEIEAIRANGRQPTGGNLREYLEATVGLTLTELGFAGFNRKFWGRELEEMPADWGRLRQLERIAESGDFRLPSQAPHHYPAGGFNPLFTALLDGFDVRYGVQVERIEAHGTAAAIRVGAETLTAEVVVATAPIDALLGYRFGPLRWRGYRIEVDVVDDPELARLGHAPDGVPFAWVYTPWPETPVCRTTDFGVIHHGPEHSGRSVVLREIPDDDVRMYPLWWESERLDRYLELAATIPGLVPLGRLGLYKYLTVDSTFAMVQRLLELLEAYLTAAPRKRVEMLRDLRGEWRN